MCQDPYLHKDLLSLCTGSSQQLFCYNKAEALQGSHLTLRIGMTMADLAPDGL